MGRPRSIKTAKILEAAQQVFLAKGADATTRDIADAAGVSQTVLFQRYRTKKNLFFAAMLPPPPELNATIGPAPPPGAQAAKVYIEELSARLLSWMLATMPCAMRAAFHPDFPEAVSTVHSPHGMERLSNALAKRLRFLQERGDLCRTMAAHRLCETLLALLHGQALSLILSPMQRDAPYDIAPIVNVVWQGISPESDSR